MPVWHSGPYPPPALEIFLSGLQRVPRTGSKPMVECDFSEVIQELVLSLKQLGVHPKWTAAADPATETEVGKLPRRDSGASEYTYS